MNHKASRALPFHSRGITLVEILLVISLLVIVASFAIPSMSSATAQSEMTAAVENVEYSIDTARKAARLNETAVRVEFSSYAGEQGQAIAVSAAEPGKSPGIPEYRLPESIELVADQASFVFDERGLVDNPGRITLVSRADKNVSASVEIK